MDEQDFMDLYGLMRGNSDATSVMDAQGLFALKDYRQTLEKLQGIQQRYESSKIRVMRTKIEETSGRKSSEQEAKERRLQKKQTRYREVMEKLDEMQAALPALIQRAETRKARELQAQQADAVDQSHEDTLDVQASEELTHSGEEEMPSLEEFIREFVAAPAAISQRELIDRCFKVRPVGNVKDVRTGELYFIDGGGQTYLAIVRKSDNPQRVRLKSAITGERLRTIDLPTFLKLGQRDRVVRLKALPQRAGDNEASQISTPAPVQESTPAAPPIEDDDDVVIGGNALQESAETAKILDKGAFSQLADAANRSGICPGADLIAHVRDRDFRLGNFQDALQTMEGIYGKFTAAAASRTAQLRQEDAAIQSGRVKMSPKDLAAKRARDAAQNQLIERARNRFSRVLDGLRVLLRKETGED
ncbi:hypothetical protein Poly24_54040 [Rosistilla carotiformis]|uniref:Uncharacterized protein n=1 Tax=Rosistilla carotiformis TaxID=2528017 RepID=A0A518K1M1_9BACT|nr:hypothetical protein [Rosistilla carotiformis]QDV71665.1 hypothetical protein Poly24_54040 [Rosistilla carotiformis]